MLSASFFLRAIQRVRVTSRAALLLILLLAFALRVFQLGAPAIWWDESLSLYRATRDLATILANTIQIQTVLTTDLQPPLYFLVLHFFVRALGTSEYALRVLTVFASTATVPLLYVLAARWFNPRVGRIAALLAALSPFYVAYAQEARPYAFVLLWSTLAVYALARNFGFRTPALAGGARVSDFGATTSSRPPITNHEPRTTNYELRTTNLEFRFWTLIFSLSAAAALYSHYYAIFLFPFYSLLITIYVWRSQRSRAWTLLPAFPLSSVIFLLPLIQRGAAGNVLSGPGSVPLHVILFDLLNSFSVGTSVDAAQVWWVDAGMFLFFVIGITSLNFGFRISDFGTWQHAIRNTNYELRITNYQLLITLLAFLALPLAALQLATLYRPLYQNSRYFIAISPAFYLGVAAGIVALASRWRYAALPALAIFLIGAAISLNNLYFNPRYGKDDHRAWAEYLRERVRPGDFLILNSPHAEELFNYYARGVVPYATLPILRADGRQSPDAENKNALRDILRKNARVWYLSMHVPFDDPDYRIARFLEDAGVEIEEAKFAGTSTAISLAQFLAAIPVVRNSRDIARPTDLLFGPALRLVGYDAPAEIESGAKGIVKLYWRLDSAVGEDYGVSLRVVDAQGATWGQWDAFLMGALVGTSEWMPRIIFTHTHDLPVAIGAPPGNYHLLLTAYRPSTGRALGTTQLTGITITRPRVPIDPAALRASVRLNQTVGAARVIGADLPQTAPQPGDTVAVAVYFQIMQKPRGETPATLQIATRAFPWLGPWTTRTETTAPLARDAEPGDIVRRDFSIRVPADARSEILFRAVVASATVEIGAVRVQDIARVTSVPDITHQMSARVGDSVEFLGYDVQPTRPRVGDTLRLTLYWRALKMMDTSFTVFTHVIDANNQIAAQQDSVPARGARPTTGWTPGEVITDVYQIVLNVPPGQYEIAIGLYDAATGARLPVSDARGASAGDQIILGTMELQ